MRLPSTLSRALKALLPSRAASIHCIGDSHASFFSGREKMQPEWPKRSDDRWQYFRSYRLGPTLAYNLCRSGASSRGREKLLDVLQRRVRPGNRVLLCFGEIDCRAHLIRQSHARGVPADELARECVDRYFQVVEEIEAMGFRAMVWNVVPPTTLMIDEGAFPVAGSFDERMAVTRRFNASLFQRCDQVGIPFVSIFEALLGADGAPDHSWFLDRVHLGPQAIALAVDALAPICPEIDFSGCQRRAEGVNPPRHAA